MFQFYLSSIKRNLDQWNRENAYKFQFYLSSIKSGIDARLTSAYGEFQFYLSSIKRNPSKSEKSLEEVVSILP